MTRDEIPGLRLTLPPTNEVLIHCAKDAIGQVHLYRWVRCGVDEWRLDHGFTIPAPEFDNLVLSMST